MWIHKGNVTRYECTVCKKWTKEIFKKTKCVNRLNNESVENKLSGESTVEIKYSGPRNRMVK